MAMNEDIKFFYKINGLIEGLQARKSWIEFNIDITKKTLHRN